MAAYSVDLRERIVGAVERHIGSNRKIAAVFGVHESFLYKLLRQKRERGAIAPLPHGGGASAKLTADHLMKLTDLVVATPDATRAELRAQLKQKARVEVSLSTLCRGLQAVGLPRKKVQARGRSRSGGASRLPRGTSDAGERASALHR